MRLSHQKRATTTKFREKQKKKFKERGDLSKSANSIFQGRVVDSRQIRHKFSRGPLIFLDWTRRVWKGKNMGGEKLDVRLVTEENAGPKSSTIIEGGS